VSSFMVDYPSLHLLSFAILEVQILQVCNKLASLHCSIFNQGSSSLHKRDFQVAFMMK
jgi:hypothetical protein